MMVKVIKCKYNRKSDKKAEDIKSVFPINSIWSLRHRVAMATGNFIWKSNVIYNLNLQINSQCVKDAF